MSSARTDGVAQLQIARTDALAKIEEARARRAKRLKAAKDEAKAEIDQYKAAQDIHYRNLEEQVRSQQGGSEDSSRQYTLEQLEKIKSSYNANKEAALNLLLTAVLNVKPCVHANFTAS